MEISQQDLDRSLPAPSAINAESLHMMLVEERLPEVIVPATICYLEADPYASGPEDAGGLLRSLFQFVRVDYWKNHPVHFELASKILENAQLELQKINDEKSVGPEQSQVYDARENILKAMELQVMLARA